jgi:serine/threonine protein kinase
MTEAHKLAGILPGYDIGAELGRGGYGVVLAGTHRQLGRKVAIKELPPKLASDPGVRSRFLAEAKILASLDHPHIVPVYDFVEVDGVCVLVMESLPGGTVWSRFTDSGYTPSAACAVVMVTCSGLHHAHQHGVLHRDVKPENLLLTETGQLKVADFGIAKVLGDNDALATNNGEILGTPAYIAPEQAQGGDLGPPADVYAAAVMLYELLSGKLPFSEEGGGLAIVYRHVYETPTPLLDVAPSVPAPLAAVVMRGLSREPADRYPTAEAFGVAIGEAATSVYGAGWFEDTAVPVLGGGPILASTQPLSSPTRDLAAPVLPPPGRLPSPSTQALPPIRPEVVSHVRGAAVDATPEGVVPVRQVLVNPPRPVLAWALTALAVAALAAVALSGFGTKPQLVPAQNLTVNGSEVAGTPVVDLSKPFVITPTGDGLAKLATQVTVDLSVAGVPLQGTTVSAPRAGAVTVKAGGNQYLAGRTVLATVSYSRGAGALVRRFAFTTKGSAFVSAPGIGAIIGLLFVLAYGESQLAPLRRRGRRRLTSTLGLALAGAGLGALAAVFAWLVGTELLLSTTVYVCAALGALGGVFLSAAAATSGRRARLRRIARKQGLTAP